MKKIAIIGASYLQEPLIKKAKERGIETHVFAWETGDVGEKAADYFYPISILEKEQILEKCKEIKIDGICSIASDLAVITVNYVANRLGLVCNPEDAVEVSTNKYKMRERFRKNGDPSPKSIIVSSIDKIDVKKLEYPVIVKPIDRSGSRGITKVDDSKDILMAVEKAKELGFRKVALIEEYVVGHEYSVEYISWNGKHEFIALTKKYTTGAPDFIETGHLEPAKVGGKILDEIKKVVEHALDSLGILYGASHSEVKIDSSGNIKIIEIGGRMGGDLIGSSLVELSTGIDYVSAVIDVALGKKPNIKKGNEQMAAAVRYVFTEEDIAILKDIKKNNPEILIRKSINQITDKKVQDSSSRFGYYLMCGEVSILERYMPSL